MCLFEELCSPPTKDRLVQFTEVLSFHLIYNVTGYYKWITKKLPFSPTLHWLLAVKLKHLSIFLDQFKLFLITFVLVCTQTCTTMCENQRTNCRSRFSLSTMWVWIWVWKSGHCLSLAAWSLPMSNLDGSQDDTGLSMIRLLLLAEMKCQWLE